MFLHPLDISLPFHFCLDCCVWGALSEGWKFIVPLILESVPSGWGWTSGLSRFLGWESFLCVLVGGAETSSELGFSVGMETFG